MSKIYVLGAFLCLLFSCNTASNEHTNEPQVDSINLAFAEVPEWSKEVVWYQIFVERFRNGDYKNDPTPADIEGSYPGFIPDNWSITTWTKDWYKPDVYFTELEKQKDSNGKNITNFDQKVQLRRYGGDLQGVMDKIDYLDSLGITAVFFNPLNDSPSLHKYDARNWRHIDRNFGPSPARDAQIMARETPDDPATWQMTGADSLFVAVIAKLHERGIRVILDYSWNHTGQTCWALKDVQQNGKKSKYADWYVIKQFNDSTTPENEFEYQGWFGVKELPEIKETVDHQPATIRAYEGNLASESVKQHIFNITKRWLDPNGDGDPSDGVDGYRLDVAAEIGLGFWREYRKVVRSINPDAYLIGEVWWESWPDKLLDPEPFLKGDVFDAVMNYRWYKAARHFFAEAPNEIPVSELVANLKSISDNLRKPCNYAMMNLAASHDVERVATSLYNKNKYKYQTKTSDNKDYKINKPDAETYQTLRLLLIHQYTYVGAPHIWAGDEMGMWGEDDPSCRKPLIWSDYTFEPETTHPLGMPRPKDEVKFDADLFAFYQKLNHFRSENPVLAHGEIEYILIDDKNKLLAYSRFNDNTEIIAVFNTGDKQQIVKLPVKLQKQYSDVLSNITVNKKGDNSLELTLEARSAVILVSK